MKNQTGIISKVSINLLFIILSLSCLLPLFLVVIISFTDLSSITSRGFSFFPEKWSLVSYVHIFKHPKLILDSYITTIIVTAVGTSGGIVISSMMAYSLSRKDFKWAGVFGFLVFFTMIFNAGLIPSYIINTRYYGLTDNILVLIIPAMIGGWNIILLRTFFFDLPYEIYEAAFIDGCSETRTFWQIVLPMSKPALATIGLFMLLNYWNSWFNSMIYMRTESNYMLQYLLYKILKESEQMLRDMQSGLGAAETMPVETVKFAMAVLVAGPILMIFPFFQKYFVKGISVGAVKG
jgi:putative aldouronate transport system permease protein